MTGVSRILSLARRLHDGQTDLQGVPYIEHLRAVATAAGVTAGSSAWVVGMLHDAVEDEKISFRDLRHHVGEDELIAIGLLTRRRDVSYDDYILSILHAPGTAGLLARAVKRADLAHNLERMTPEIRVGKPALEPRYSKALLTLGVEEQEMIRS